MDLTRWRTPGEDLPRNMVKSQKGFWPLQGPCTEVSSLDGNFIKPVLNFLRPCGLTPRNGLWWSRPAVTTAGWGDDSLRLSRNTRVLQPILVCIYFPWLLVLAKERCYTWKMRLLHPQKMTNKSCQALKGKKGTDQLLHYQHLKGKSWGVSKLIRSRLEEITAKFSQGSGLPKSFLKTSLQALRERLVVDRKSRESLGDVTFMAFSFWQLAVS